MAAPPRILLCGDVLGRLDQLYKRFAAVNKSAGPFDVLLCVGQFFPQSSEQLDQFMNYVEGRVEIPIATYFIGDFGAGAPKVLTAASKAAQNQGFKMDGLKISDNLYWLKGSGKFQLQGLSVAYLSGRRSSIIQPFGTYSQDDVDALRAMAEEPEIVDIFLTNEWPSGITNKAVESGIPPGVSDSSGFDSTVAELVSEIKPRYHVAGTMGVFYAREPYINVDSSHVTRFLGLAPVRNKDKQKFIHAISPTPASIMSAVEMCKKPPNASLSPYIDLEKISQADSETKRPAESDLQYWRYDVSQKRQKTGAGDAERRCFKFVSSGSCPRGDKCHFVHDNDAREQYLRGVCFDFINKGKCEKGSDCSFKHSFQDNAEDVPKMRTGNGKVNRSKECWFCLSSPNIESHLIISIGDSFYCALPKGPLLEDHVLVVPIEHAPNTLSTPSESETELQKFLSSLKAYYKNLDKEVVWFEWIYRRGTHANLQVKYNFASCSWSDSVHNLQ
uniref:C3H1-type domain-containing protein n=1 Tax=Kalanchoe fedtschenkoi TaxID=63787 RepID=A0A7N0UTD5_KALFE